MPAASANGVFDFPLDPNQDPRLFKNAGTANLFYMVNIMHGMSFEFGFDEAAGNFQKINYSGAGKGNDRVTAEAQVEGLIDNASMVAPPDGISPSLQMGLYANGNQIRDSSLDNEVVVHEFSHGITERLTGPTHRADCLQTPEARALAEGWSDFIALYMSASGTDTRDTPRTFGEYVNFGNQRDQPYSTNPQINSLSYESLNTLTEEHDAGAIWATILWEVYWGLVDKLGFTEARMTPNNAKGNTLALQIIMNALTLQACNPTFIQARDAITDAEWMTSDSQYTCNIWASFAKRGLGVGAKFDGQKYVKSNALPLRCQMAFST
ncbi:peptidase M36 [Thamnocephalis sphaerospora]|uniref:Extracellular metalloproteinase n=1 Tax=Thamnocephalis sphaerospora TaxID=78915 RepID=A0A4P9XHL7_9FUNG|nr:peptidase M36 [Thamnocephalis sphaerospora]|eukprot:RKP04781.1 peptidase M36 [Thamnocephalis sphaerospora]